MLNAPVMIAAFCTANGLRKYGNLVVGTPSASKKSRLVINRGPGIKSSDGGGGSESSGIRLSSTYLDMIFLVG